MTDPTCCTCGPGGQPPDPHPDLNVCHLLGCDPSCPTCPGDDPTMNTPTLTIATLEADLVAAIDDWLNDHPDTHIDGTLPDGVKALVDKASEIGDTCTLFGLVVDDPSLAFETSDYGAEDEPYRVLLGAVVARLVRTAIVHLAAKEVT